MSVRFCGFGVCGDRGGPEEACGQLLPCAAHPDAINPEELIRERDELRGIIEASDAGPLFERLDAQHLRVAEPGHIVNVVRTKLRAESVGEQGRDLVEAITDLEMRCAVHDAADEVKQIRADRDAAIAAIEKALKWLRLSDEQMSPASMLTQTDRAMLTLSEYLRANGKAAEA